jgi:myo-inositol 2-dehydrogenase/D-chiro-inositol 1-dehydrogenase
MTLKLAVVGTGSVATGNYLPWLAQQADVQLGCFSRTPAKAAAAAAACKGRCFASLDELAAWRPDSVLVLTKETDRRDVAGRLVELGMKRLFLEKPLVAAAGQAAVGEQDFLDGKALLARAAAKGIPTAMQFNYRFFDQVLAAKALVAERALGPVVNASALVHYACWSHVIDLIHHFAGPVAEIAAVAGGPVRSGQGITAPDVSAAFRTVGGASGTITGSAGLAWQHPLFELVLTFAHGRIALRDIDGDLELLDGRRQSHERISLVRDRSRWDHYTTSFHKALAAYLDSLRQDAPAPVPGIDGLRELQFEAALRRSIAQRRTVVLDQDFPL